ncbi:acyl carrier protein [Haloarcula salinisoli]|uniref:Carrier domain-containing protein n=1 Tax=Haloarcula salinisoli TaxID=2487746 RepID=A0A8J7YIA1_9EURY|nr:phosphopantetheine-binding protein [Halomicroarcula salinisoli]MBX0288655.1 hypothetical protein [Halomicroarcula salinisoli]MBX0306052.1 hypothetical protein [Halomicroarcula salinisoli]
MSSTTEEDRVASIISNRLHVEESEFEDDTPITGDVLDAESLDIVEIAEAIDENLDVYISDEELEEMETVGDLKSFVKSVEEN